MKRQWVIGLMMACTMQAGAVAPRWVAVENNPMTGAADAICHAQTAMHIPMAPMTTEAIGTVDLMPKALVIMVEFADWQFEKSTTREWVDSLFNGRLYHQTMTEEWLSYSSVAQYFNDQSNGNYRPEFDVVGPVRVQKSYTAYPGTTYGSTLLSDACALVDNEVDFSRYDTDGNGTVDMVFLYFAGYGQNDAGYITDSRVTDQKKLIWPHMGSSRSGTKKDGKTLYKYECCNELDGYISWNSQFGVTGTVHAGIGTLCHEFSHGLGLPDVYSTEGGAWRMGQFDLMDYGNYSDEGYTPVNYTAYERWFFGWLEPQAANKPENIQLEAIGKSNTAYVQTANGTVPANANTTGGYYLLENRQAEGWDKNLWATGLLVTHIQYNATKWSSNTVNTGNDPANYGICPVTATGETVDKGRQDFSYVTFPYNDICSLNVTANYPISDIQQEANGDITFKVCGGDTTAGMENDNDNGNHNDNGKRIRNGQMVIVRGGKAYTVGGVRIDR